MKSDDCLTSQVQSLLMDVFQEFFVADTIVPLAHPAMLEAVQAQSWESINGFFFDTSKLTLQINMTCSLGRY